MVRRVQNHHLELTRYINATIGLPFVWGERDCVTYAVGAIEAMIGRELDKPPITYTSSEEALVFAESHSLEETMVDQLHAYEVPHRFHQPGDIAIVNRDGFECVHVVFDRRAYAPLLGGVVRMFSVDKLYQECPDVKILRFD